MKAGSRSRRAREAAAADRFGYSRSMALLYSYLRHYRGLIGVALVLATINQVFSLLDPLIFRYVIDNYATRFSEYTTREFFRGVTHLLAAAVGVAFVSRVANNFHE
jgi:ATP-binding cassette subfamily B protein